MGVHFTKAIETEHLEWKLVFKDVYKNAKLEMTFLLKAIYVRQRGDWFYENYMEVTSRSTEQKGTTEKTVSPISHIPKDKGSSRLSPSRVYIHFHFNIDLIWHEVFLN